MKKISLLIGALCLATNLFAYEIGDGMGSSYKYPSTQFDTNNYPESPATYWTWQKADDTKECISTIEQLLGANPQGTFRTVRSRLDYLDLITSSATIKQSITTGTIIFNDGFSITESTPILVKFTQTFRPTGVYQEALSNPGATTYWNDIGYLIDNDTMTYTWIYSDATMSQDVIASVFPISLDPSATIISVIAKGVGSIDEGNGTSKVKYRIADYSIKTPIMGMAFADTATWSDSLDNPIPSVSDLNSSTFSIIMSQIMGSGQQTLYNDVYLQVEYTLTTSSVFARGYVTKISSSGDTRIQTEGSILPYYNCDAERLTCNLGSSNYYWNEIHYHSAITHSLENIIQQDEAVDQIYKIDTGKKETFGEAYVKGKTEAQKGTDINKLLEMLIKTNQFLLDTVDDQNKRLNELEGK